MKWWLKLIHHSKLSVLSVDFWGRPDPLQMEVALPVKLANLHSSYIKNIFSCSFYSKLFLSRLLQKSVGTNLTFFICRRNLAAMTLKIVWFCLFVSFVQIFLSKNYQKEELCENLKHYSYGRKRKTPKVKRMLLITTIKKTTKI